MQALVMDDSRAVRTRFKSKLAEMSCAVAAAISVGTDDHVMKPLGLKRRSKKRRRCRLVF